MAGSIRAGAPEKFYRGRRGSDAALVGRTPPRAPPLLSIVGSRRNGISGGFSGPRARPSVIFSSQQLGVTVGGCAAFYSAVLSCEPEHPVAIYPGNLPACIRVSPSLLVFSHEDWRTPQFFRVTVLASVHDDNNKDDCKLQVIEHVGSSMDSRFNGNKILYLPPTVLVQITGREGCYLFTSGNSLATITASTTGDPRAKASFSSSTYHEFVQIELDATPNPPQLSLQKVSVASAAGITNDALEAQDGVSALVSRRSSSRRNLTASASSASLAPSLQSLQSSSVDGHYHSTHRDGTALVKAVCRADHTLLLYKSGNWGMLGTMHVDYSTEEQTLEADLIGVYGSRGSNSTLSRMLIDIECGDAHVVALTEQGYVMTWGEGKDGRLGHGKACSIRAPHVVKSLFHKRILHIACGARHSVAVAEDGDVFSWGDGKCGALGHGLNEHEQHFDLVNMPMEILSLKSKGVARVACGDMHTAVVLLDGSLLTCGWSANGRLGRNCPKKSEFSSVFELVDMKTRLCAFVVCGAAHTLVLTECNSVYGFGWNGSGQLDLGDRRTRGVPTKIQYFATDDLIVVSLAAGKLHSMAMTQDARAFAWGSDELGQCGIGSFPQIYTVPHLVASTVGVSATQISAGESHSVVLTTASQKQLDALEVNHPSRYASLMESFELFVRRDRELQAKVLAFAKENEWKREAARRNRKPPIDPSFSLARTLQQELLGIENNNSAHEPSRLSTAYGRCSAFTAFFVYDR
uniref:RCC1-like domain-containing protein n=1 Tax=Globisporangium ultimum (strain ATCC 200006 / CBS 805.95 / DAOM BR144) TaxID=431595 RepID=K3WLR5_GLOUD